MGLNTTPNVTSLATSVNGSDATSGQIIIKGDASGNTTVTKQGNVITIGVSSQISQSAWAKAFALMGV